MLWFKLAPKLLTRFYEAIIQIHKKQYPRGGNVTTPLSAISISKSGPVPASQVGLNGEGGGRGRVGQREGGERNMGRSIATFPAGLVRHGTSSVRRTIVRSTPGSKFPLPPPNYENLTGQSPSRALNGPASYSEGG